jgi:dUTP pyrophosphatase
MPQILYIQPVNDRFAESYHTFADLYNGVPLAIRNSGFDLFCDITDVSALGENAVLVGQGCRAVAIDTETGEGRAFWLAPRSSIGRTPWRLANSMGLIDAPYRGVIRAGLSNVGLPVRPVFDNSLNGQRLCQLVAADLRPWSQVRVVAELPVEDTPRGEGGFGSTGR